MKLLKWTAYTGVAGIVLLLSVYFIVHSLQETADLNQEARAKAPGKFITLTQGLVHYRLEGSDTGRLLLFIPGGGISGIEVFEKIIPHYNTQGYRTLTFDLYGRGYTDRPRVTNNPDLFLTQVTELLDSLRLDTKMDVICMSMGAITALDLATRFPGRVNKLVLIDPSAAGEFKANALLKIPVVSDFLLTVYWYPKAVENQRKEFVSQVEFEAYAKRLEYFMNFDGYKFTNYSTWMNMLTVSKLELLRALPDSTVFLIHGKQDPYFPAERTVDLYKSVYPTLRAVSIDQAGHLPHLEKPEEVALAIDDFLK